MPARLLTLFILSSVLFSSCMSSLFPLSYNDKDFIFNSELIGTWGNLNDTSEYFIADTVNGFEGRLYKITSITYDSGKLNKSERLAHLIQLDGTYILDSWFDDRCMVNNEYYPTGMYVREHLFEHLFAKLKIVNRDEIGIFLLNDSLMEELIDRHEIDLNYIVPGKESGRLLLDIPEILQNEFGKGMRKYPDMFWEEEYLKLLRLPRQSGITQKE